MQNFKDLQALVGAVEEHRSHADNQYRLQEVQSAGQRCAEIRVRLQIEYGNFHKDSTARS
jgi:hypothetical protein